MIAPNLEILPHPMGERRADLPEWLSEIYCSDRRPYSCMATICHHMGQPATVLSITINLLRARLVTSADPELRHLLDALLDASQNLNRMLHDMQDTCVAGNCLFTTEARE